MIDSEPVNSELADADAESLVAIVGMAARFGQAGDLHAYRELLRTAGEEDVKGSLADPYRFDHTFFGISPREAVVLDPQHRFLLECAYHAMEDAAHDPSREDAVVGIYAGGASTAHAAQLRRRADLLPHVDDRQLRAATGADFLASRVAYKLGFTGPAVSVQAASCTALVAVHTALQALLGGECDLALAGAVTVHPEADDTGGCAVFLLKPLPAALADGDRIHAVVGGSAVGTSGVGESPTAGRARVLHDAVTVSGNAQDTVAVFDAPAGAEASDSAPAAKALVRAVLGLTEGLPLPSHVALPNRGASPNLAVSASGPFGTHASVVLHEPPASVRSTGEVEQADSWQLLPYSARSKAALAGTASRLGEHLTETSDALADIATTLQVHRVRHPHRGFVVARDTAEAAQALATGGAGAKGRKTAATPPSVMFTFPGHGGQHLGMGRELYRGDALFRRDADECAELVRALTDVDLRAVLNPTGEAAEAAAREALTDGAVAQLAVFVLEYTLAHAFRRWGVQPSAVVGHSLGGYAAACVAGVFSFSDGVRLVARRTELLLSLAPGAMAAVRMSEDELVPLLPEGVGVAVFSGPEQVTISGPRESVVRFVEESEAKGLEVRLLKIPGAGHSSLVESVLEEYARFAAGIAFHQPTIPVISDTTGTWADPEDIATPEYWCRHMREAVRYHDVLETMAAVPDSVLLEVGPGTTLTTLARRCEGLRRGHPILHSLTHPTDPTPDSQILLTTLGALWSAGVEIDWSSLYPDRGAARGELPAYPFQRTEFPLPVA